jgi:hypothetical protein
VTDVDADRYLAGRYASGAGHAPLDLASERDAGFLVDAFEGMGVLGADAARAWRHRIERLALEWTDRPLLREEFRDAARALRAAQDRDRPDDDGWVRSEAQRVLEAVGALSWRDAGADSVPTLVVDRVLAAPAHAIGEATISTVVQFSGAVRVHWYCVLPLVDGRLELAVADDVGTRYASIGEGHASGGGQPIVGSTTFTPGVPAGATWLDVARAGTRIVRVPLV